MSNGDAPTAQDLLVAAGRVEQLLRPLVTAEWSVQAGGWNGRCGELRRYEIGRPNCLRGGQINPTRTAE